MLILACILIVNKIDLMYGGKNMRKLWLTALVVCITLSLSPIFAATDAEKAALKTVAGEISAALAGRSDYATPQIRALF